VSENAPAHTREWRRGRPRGRSSSCRVTRGTSRSRPTRGRRRQKEEGSPRALVQAAEDTAQAKVPTVAPRQWPRDVHKITVNAAGEVSKNSEGASPHPGVLVAGISGQFPKDRGESPSPELSREVGQVGTDSESRVAGARRSSDPGEREVARSFVEQLIAAG